MKAKSSETLRMERVKLYCEQKQSE